ncbi:hypothetical protein X769_07530 [Mesorhizobium sp. LSJC268A00]|nr:hypothetical protein X769_07530 [Mesorhizobium sp. LSJC268A00]
MSDSLHPAPFKLILTWAGNVPSPIFRYIVERDKPVRARTVLRRMIRSSSGMAALSFAQSIWHLLEPDRTTQGRRAIRFVIASIWGVKTAANRRV